MKNYLCLVIALLMCAVSFGKTAIPETAKTENKKQIVVLGAGAGKVAFEVIARVLETQNKVLIVVGCETPGTVVDAICAEQLKIEKLLFTLNEPEIYIPDVGKPKGNWQTNLKINKTRFAQKFTAQRYKTPRDNI